MNLRRIRLSFGHVLTGVFALVSADPAFAQTAGVGGNIGTFIQMDPSQLILLRAGMPPVRGRKIVYWREKAFTARVLPPPIVATHPGIAAGGGFAAPTPAEAPVDRANDLTLDLVMPALEEAGLEPLPAEGASATEVEAWVERFIDAAVKPPPQEISHAR